MNKKIILLSAFCILHSAFTSAQNWKTGNPSDPNYAYLKEYKNLKDYVDREKYPNFKVGLALGANDYNNNSTWKGLADANFDELVTGNEMKMASCVSNSGTMNFNTVKNFVNKAYAAGHHIYGHTLAWHAQQPRGWLLSLMNDHPAQPIPDADTPVYQEFYCKDFRTQQNIGWHADFADNNYNVSYDATNGMKVTVTKKAPQNYYVQYWAASDIPAKKGEKVKMIITMKGSKAGYTYARVGDWDVNCPNKNINFTTEWQDYEWEVTPTIANPGVLLQHGDFVGDLYIKQIRFEKVVMGKTVNENRRCLVIETPADAESASTSKLTMKVKSVNKGDKYVFSAYVRADKAAKVEAEMLGTVPFTPTWRTITMEGTFQTSSDNTLIRFYLAQPGESNRFFFDNISFSVNGEERIINGDFEGTDASSFSVSTNGSRPKAPEISENITYLLLPTSTPLTAEEKHDALVGAMEKWIKGMMEACDGKVKAWDLVNEAISGGDSDGDGIYDLQHDWELKDEGGFFWQDFMGDLEYVRQACRLARKYGPSDIKLFINDYNLESDWDNNGKLRSLIKWIERWEADGVTHIDGIGSQMHISCSMNPSTLASCRKHIRQMFELMAASGKLVRVSELDMGMDDANGKGVQTADMTEEMHKMMADHYEYILKTYFEVVPPEQQWGICQWCGTDAPTNSGWRGGEPVGIWDSNYYRKHAYAGFVRGLGGKVYSTDIKDIDNSKKIDTSKGIYNINGVKTSAKSLDELPSGLYIINGKKVVK